MTEFWVGTVNAAGGIKAGGDAYKVEIVYVDYQSSTPRAVQTAERLITQARSTSCSPPSAPAR